MHFLLWSVCVRVKNYHYNVTYKPRYTCWSQISNSLPVYLHHVNSRLLNTEENNLPTHKASEIPLEFPVPFTGPFLKSGTKTRFTHTPGNRLVLGNMLNSLHNNDSKERLHNIRLTLLSNPGVFFFSFSVFRYKI